VKTGGCISRFALAAALLAFAAQVAAQAVARQPAPESREIRIASPDAGIELLLRNESLAATKSLPARRTVLFVHGATFPASSTFGVSLPGVGSWMSFVASRGFDVFSLDIRGYGGSTRPAAMSQPPEASPPFAGAKEAVRDISAAVDYILAQPGARKPTLIGWSWGTTTTAGYAAEHPGKIERLVLVAPVWLGVKPLPYQGAYRVSTYESARAFSLRGMPEKSVEMISPRENFDAWWKATLATDPEGARRSPAVVRSPNGVMRDFNESWAAGKPTYDPAKIRAPTLLLVGDWDAVTPPAMAQGLYEQLTHAAERRLVRFSEATHFMIIEKHRSRLFMEVQNFLDQVD
jgi:pimeloyl-ACP methyl ester carboxylesterase